MLMVFCYSLWKRWFFMFSGGMKRLVSWNLWGQFLECEAFLNLECKKSCNLFDLCLQNIFLAVAKSLFVENFFDQRKILFPKHFLVYGKLLPSCKTFAKFPVFVQNLNDCRKVAWLWKSFWTAEKILDYGKFIWLYKSSLIKENLLSWLQKK